MLSNPTIGVAMIVKDAELSVAQAIYSARKYAHQIVIVDTGSIDNTPNLFAPWR
ncbi:MAG: hypothetical protein IPM69_15255 [Ignavibacteria bacterium]|nr:hypothetical protein [Ignavibacteria bacterium]